MKQKQFKVPCILLPKETSLNGVFGISDERAKVLSEHMAKVSKKSSKFEQHKFIEECCSICENTNEIAIVACAVGLHTANLQNMNSKHELLKHLLGLYDE